MSPKFRRANAALVISPFAVLKVILVCDADTLVKADVTTLTDPAPANCQLPLRLPVGAALIVVGNCIAPWAAVVDAHDITVI